jgi:hypothetical protein
VVVVESGQKANFETLWFGGAAQANVIELASGSWALGNTADEIVLSDASATERWRLAYVDDESPGRSTFLTGNDFSISDYGNDVTPLVVRNGNDGVAGNPLGYEGNDHTADAFAFSATTGDVGSPLAGQYSPIPEPGTLALLGLGLVALCGARRRRA